MLRKQGIEHPDIEVVFVLGNEPKVVTAVPKSDADYIQSTLEQINGRIVFYDQLISNALAQYEEYLQASTQARQLDELLGSIDDADADGTPQATAEVIEAAS